ncbi:hypothetical protein PR048_032291 [Dryococelus australis]|uniref:Uncharacterized protein n=1 Tax=Dryococelus australis TaxID=614101 RepID=A0ABQ9G2M7_9NEOP|nr:hypothetical protein PR048_032291 [Dryococelus australis]
MAMTVPERDSSSRTISRTERMRRRPFLQAAASVRNEVCGYSFGNTHLGLGITVVLNISSRPSVDLGRYGNLSTPVVSFTWVPIVIRILTRRLTALPTKHPLQQRAPVAEQLDCSPPKSDWVRSPAGSLPRIFASGNHAGRCHWSAGFLGDLPFPPPSHSGASTFSPHFTHIGS